MKSLFLSVCMTLGNKVVDVNVMDDLKVRRCLIIVAVIITELQPLIYFSEMYIVLYKEKRDWNYVMLFPFYL